MSFRLTRSQLTTALLAILVVLAGCSGVGGSDPEPSSTSESTATAEDPTDETNTDEEDTAHEQESELSGRMLVVIEGQDTHLDSGPDASFWFDESNEHTWHAEESMTLAEALEQSNVEASAGSLTYEGETYRESDGNTSITYRVAGTEIEDPTEYELRELEPDHEIVVRVDTDNQETPGRHFEQSHPHPHGTLNVTVEGESVDFTQEKYVLSNDAFHFHGDENGSRWHGHSVNLTVAYAVSTFPGMDLTGESLTYNGSTYRADDTETSLTVTVNGEPVDPSTYVLKDGDAIEVEVNQAE